MRIKCRYNDKNKEVLNEDRRIILKGATLGAVTSMNWA